MLNWTQRERDLGFLIISMIEDKRIQCGDLDLVVEFTPIEINRYGSDILKYLWNTENYYLNPIFRSLKNNHKELTQPKGNYYPYRVSNYGYLSEILYMRKRHSSASLFAKIYSN